jgi:hypothetical protein
MAGAPDRDALFSNGGLPGDISKSSPVVTPPRTTLAAARPPIDSVELSDNELATESGRGAVLLEVYVCTAPFSIGWAAILKAVERKVYCSEYFVPNEIEPI